MLASVTAVKLGQAHTLLSINLLFFFIWGVYLYICAFVHLCICLFVCLCICVFVYLRISHVTGETRADSHLAVTSLNSSQELLGRTGVIGFKTGRHLCIFCVIVYLCVCVIVFVYFRPGASVSKLANICRDVYLARCSWTPHSLTIYTLEKTLFFARFQLYQPTIGNIFLMHRNLKNYKAFQPSRTGCWTPHHKCKS